MIGWTIAAVVALSGLASGPAWGQTYGARAYVANYGGDTVSVIDDGSRKVVATITTGARPVSVTIAPDGGAVYVSNEGANSLSVIDPATNTVIGTVSLSGSPRSVVLTLDGAFALVAVHDQSAVEVVDTRARASVGKIAVGRNPDLLALSIDGKEAYVTCEAESSIAVVDVEQRARVGEIRVFGAPRSMVVLGTGKLALTMRWLNGFALVDARERKIVGGWLVPQIRLPGESGVRPFPKEGVFGSGIGGYASGGVALWLSDSEKLFYDVDTSKDNYIVGFASTGANPWTVAVSPDGKTAYVTNSGDDNVSLIDMIQRIPVGKPPVGKNPRAMALGRVKTEK